MFEIPQETEALTELGELRQWVCWKMLKEKNKVPFNAMTGKPASSTRQDSWTDFNTAVNEVIGMKNCNSSEPYTGIGFVFTASDPYVGVDLDKCISTSGHIEQWALDIIKDLDSYTELSPSGKGFHIFVRGDKPHSGCKTNKFSKVEIYSKERYFTFTGNHWEGTPECINARQDALDRTYYKHVASKEDVKAERVQTASAVDVSLLPAVPLPALKFGALLTNDRKFAKSWNHERTDMSDQSNSGYDLSLLTIACKAGWTDQELHALLIAHRSEQGDPDKAHREDYALRQISLAKNAKNKDLKDTEVEKYQDIEAVRGGETREILAVLSETLGISIEKIIKRGKEDAVYYFVIDGEEALIGNSIDIFNFVTVKRRILDFTLLVVRDISRKRWDNMMNIAVSIIEDDPEYMLTRKIEIMESVVEYLQRRTLFSGDEWKVGLESDEPFRKDDRVWLHCNRMLMYMSNMPGGDKSLTKAKLQTKLRELGFTRKVFCFERKGIPTSRSYWGSPSSFDYKCESSKP